VRKLFAIFGVCFSLSAFANPIVIAHRGASGYLPEHTLEAVTLAFTQGADFIEQDLVLSKDGVPVVLHDIHLDTVTDVAQLFPDRKRDDGRFYAIDFSLQELKQLTVHERKNLQGKQVYPQRYGGKAGFTIPTFEEELELIQQLNRQFGKNVGIYPEIKSPAWHKQQGLDISVIVLSILRKHKLDNSSANIYLQCFDFAEVKRLRLTLNAKLKLVQLLAENDWQESDSDYDRLKSKEGLADIAKVAQGIGPWYPQLLNVEQYPATLTPLSSQASALGLEIHAYTHRVDGLPAGFSSPQLLDALIKQAKVTGVFSDFPDTVVKYLQQ